MKDTKFWLQLLLSAVLGIGGTSLLVAFKEQLPELFYNIFLYVVWSVVVVKLTDLMFGGLIKRLTDWIKKKQRQRTRRKTANRLFDKWLDLTKLIEEVISNDWKPNEDQKHKYFDFHLWFTANRSRYLSSWYEFDRLRTDMAHDSIYWDSTGDIGYEVFRENYKDPFSYFYAPLSIEHLCHILERRQAGEVRIVMSKLTELTLEFVRWTRLE